MKEVLKGWLIDNAVVTVKVRMRSDGLGKSLLPDWVNGLEMYRIPCLGTNWEYRILC